MKLKYLVYLIIALSGFVLITAGPGCANIIPPTGGPRDSLPPVLLNAAPKDSTLKFVGKKIILTFDEYVQTENLQQNLIVSPVPNINPTVESKLKTVTIIIRDTLKDNTTYALDFGNAIKDVNEGNVFKNFTYVFSTGTKIDSLTLGGRVVIAETGKTDSTIVMMLYKNLDDSAVVKDKPRYVTRTDSTGHFRFKFLEPGTFRLYAVKDEGGARRYQSKSSLFAFYDSTVTSNSQRNDLLLYAFIEKDTTKKPGTEHGAAPEPARKGKGKEEEKRFIRIQNNLSNGELDLLSNLEITAPTRLYHFDSTKIKFLKDSTPVTSSYFFLKDTSGKKITLKYPWAEGTSYTVIIDTSFATDSSGRRIFKNDTLAFATKKENEYGAVRLRFLNLQLSRHPLLQFVQGEDIKFSQPLKGREFYAKLFEPGEYDLRIVYDDNQNGIWDSGIFFGKHQQPEKVQLIPRKLTVKINWDNEIDITL